MQRSFSLEKYRGTASRHTCPGCGGKRCFTLYVDEAGNPLDPSVGRCDHESGSGYHLTPAQYFKEHPELTGKDWRDDEPEWLAAALKRREEEKKKPLCLIPGDIVRRSVRPERDSDFTAWLRTVVQPEAVGQIVRDYRIGLTKAGDVIFFQIDVQGRCRTGKVMKYDRNTGHRIKDEATKGRITWIHSLMKWSGTLPQEWQLTQCLFGEHLLPAYPKKAVALVESEKTAVICSALMPQYVWLATGGKSQFNDRLNVLSGRDVIAFPDIDGYATWCEKVKSFTGLNITVSGILQQNATADDFEAHIDIADWLIRWKQHPESFQRSEWNATCAKVLPLISPEYRDNVKQLIEELELVVIE